MVLSCPFADEAADVAVVGAEVVPPLREAVRFVNHPRADFTLLERSADGDASELLRRDEEDAGIPEADAVEGVRLHLGLSRTEAPVRPGTV